MTSRRPAMRCLRVLPISMLSTGSVRHDTGLALAGA